MKNLVEGEERLKEEQEGMREHEKSGRRGGEIERGTRMMKEHEESGRRGGEIERGTRGHERA